MLNEKSAEGSSKTIKQIGMSENSTSPLVHKICFVFNCELRGNILLAIYITLFCFTPSSCLTQNTSIPNQPAIFVLYSKNSPQMRKKKRMQEEEQHTKFLQNVDWRSLGDFAHSLAEERKRRHPAFIRKKARAIGKMRLVVHA